MSIDDYNIRNYTDAQLYSILDINNPTDRELEAKIVGMTRQFSLMNNETGRRMVQFFTDIYNHFFDETAVDTDDVNSIDEDNDTSFKGSLFEGMTTEQSQGIDANAISGNFAMEGSMFSPSTTTGTSDRSEGAGKVGEVGEVTTIEYTKGTVNPLLRETVKRVISIDSQYRDNKSGLSTEFTFNLSDPLQNVVALRLYSVQIPFTWYTINNNFGGNFFYIKGNSEGIDNDAFQYRIEVPSGNYTPLDLVTAVNANIANLKTSVTDISFGTTGISYNPNTSRATITLDINNTYNENGYVLEFPEWSSPNNIDNIDNTGQFDRYKENSTLAAFLGYNYISYNLNVVYSTRTFPDLSNSNRVAADDRRSYPLDVSNNTIYIKRYSGTSYNPSNTDNVVNTITITLPIDPNNISQTRNELLLKLNTALSTSPYLTNSYIERVDISNLGNQVVANNGKSYFKLNITLNRSTTINQRGLRTVVIFPDESTFNRNTIWGESIRDSCFSFKSLINEINDVSAETRLYESNYIFRSTPYIELQCIKNGFERRTTGPIIDPSFTYNARVAYNDYRIYVDLSSTTITGYSLSSYLEKINDSFRLTNTSSINDDNPAGIFSNTSGVQNDLTTDNKVRFRFDMTKTFPINNFKLNYGNAFTNKDLSGNVIRHWFSGSNIALSNTNYVFSSIPVQSPFGISKGNLLFTVQPNSGNLHTENYSVTYDASDLVQGGIETYIGVVNAAIKGYRDSNGNQPFATGTELSYEVVSDSPFAVIFKLSIALDITLNEKDYRVIFYDPSAGSTGWSETASSNSWKNLLIGDQSYNLITYAVPGTTYSDIFGTGTLTGYTFSLRENTYFTLRALSNGIATTSGAYDIRIDIPAATANNNTYTKGEIFDIINTAFLNNSLTRGSEIYQYNDENGVSYISMKIVINKTFTTQDYRLVFYDPYSFATCTAGITSIKNVTWDSTLGWILGFRSYTEYLIPTNGDSNITVDSNTNIATIVGSVTVTTQLYNYFMIILDDYTQSHLNDGLITITPQEQDVTSPSYATKSNYQCDPSTGNVVFSGATDGSQTALTAKQIYSANQILAAKNAKKITSYSRGPFVKDVFGIIPVKTSGLSPGSYYVEFGGTLQNQERIYFGPVNLHRMTVKLVNDRGESVDLNGSNWSFSLVCEMLYNQTQSTSK